MKKRKAPGELELEILHLLSKKEGASVSELMQELKGNYAYTTVLTVLTRMYKKKELSRVKVGRQYHYSTQHSKPDSLLHRIKKRLFGNQTAGMIQYLIESSDPLSSKEIQEIQKLLNKVKDE